MLTSTELEIVLLNNTKDKWIKFIFKSQDKSNETFLLKVSRTFSPMEHFHVKTTVMSLSLMFHATEFLAVLRSSSKNRTISVKK